MTKARSNPVRDVLLLMMVRHMPEHDFMSLCQGVMDTSVSPPVLPSVVGSTRNFLVQKWASGSRLCEVCGGSVASGRLERTAKAAAGMSVCKGCIDQTLGTLFGGDPNAEAVAAHAVHLASGGATQ